MAEAGSPFALGTFAAGNEEFPGLVVGDRTLNLSHTPAIPGNVLSIVEAWDAVSPRLAELAADSDSSRWCPLAELSVRAPLRPRQIVQAGANYRTHVIDLAVKHAELGPERTEQQVRAETTAMMDRRAMEGEPYLFAGLPGAVTGPYDEVVLPGYSEQHDWELELAAVIGRRTFRVDRESAPRHVAAYTIANDLTTRDLVFRGDMPEIGTDWLRAKNAPGFLPTGPWLVPSEFVDPGDLRLTLELNDEVMQDESTEDMIFDVAALVSAASRTVELLPGDLVLTGSPAGNGLHHGRLLRPGDVMTSTITGLGTQRTPCVVEEA
ncbi:2-keto-4-pentenoate hydratase/2-oxohepta-3-ene-1,7-dioic acid hydratase (catechol pathway) [Actinopolyspora xinjiangensis]|uniref:2-keto-4-pentenoate hydratase/2-oxohepta-3-ene-1,7-dioic acid hydratase (Catechol pathway) n=1 Tax=Actinopolyspora xinjiangensis TaxID=405564 RepID=A0A1H0S6Y5_9ACTN|nr:fumarylacetoacetate hydrolase family protein [Actinopolyspora xinjiangensis]SDP37427.1 2-keto-4-pentenoate hydratase/2-oxohepta-3-ene-1,7-dioic acid hydratase (catechol pathway) [Actinopolyspora xinjiangensis]